MKPERIEELACSWCERDDLTPLEVTAAIRDAIREFADEAVRRMDANPGASPYADIIETFRDEVLGKAGTKEGETCAMTAAPQWISVAERLPPRDGSWIVVTSTHNRYYRAAVRWTDEGWQDANKASHGDDKAITHWMPLSEPPKT